MNRRRNKAITIRLTYDEYELFQNKFLQSDMKCQADFFVSCLSKKEIRVIEDLRPLLVEIKKQGINLNQIARYFNAHDPREANLASVIQNLNLVYRELYKWSKREDANI